jgi:DSF synthase
MGNIAHLADQAKFRVQANASRPWLNKFNNLSEIDISVDEEDGIMWKRMRHADRASASFSLLTEMLEVFETSTQGYHEDIKAKRNPIKYMVLASNLPNIFLLGGDLPFFLDKIRDGDRASLSLYAYQCINVVHKYVNGLNFPVHTISLVQGDTLGGGFEAALATDAIIAERSAKFGLPEVLFNLFPGMGAYALLSRKLDMVRAERIIMSGKLYTAEEMYEMGLVHQVVEDGQGEAALYEYIEQYERQYTSRHSITRARQLSAPVSYQELKNVVDVWVDAAMNLSTADQRKMQLVIKAQNRRLTGTTDGVVKQPEAGSVAEAIKALTA